MGQCNGASRLSSIKSQVILTQTDTTVGFVSQDKERLNQVKSRPSNKHFLRTFVDLKTLKNNHIRIPNSKKKLLRRAKKTTFIVNNKAFRVASFPLHSQVLRNLVWSYSTSANKSGHNFEREYCNTKADIIIEDKNGLFESQASRLLKINNKTIKRLR
ncbi:MAG: hypothetical protein FAF05_05945 [Epsilonproteobacteria bacterium]|nr:hypothetical protein [Campylobacterota bacterium]